MTNTEKFTLRDYQLQVIKETYQYFRNGARSLLIYAPTGAGKTAIACKALCKNNLNNYPQGEIIKM